HIVGRTSRRAQSMGGTHLVWCISHDGRQLVAVGCCDCPCTGRVSLCARTFRVGSDYCARDVVSLHPLWLCQHDGPSYGTLSIFSYCCFDGWYQSFCFRSFVGLLLKLKCFDDALWNRLGASLFWRRLCFPGCVVESRISDLAREFSAVA